MNGLNILLLEDDPLDADLIQEMLEELAYDLKFRRIETRTDFLSQIKQFIPDVILSDYTLPQYNGLEALADTQAIDDNIPFILVTGTMSEETAAETIKAGAWDYVVKERLARLPVAVEHALQRREGMLERKRAREKLREMQELINQTQMLAKVGGWEYDTAAERIMWTDEVYRIYGVDPEVYDPNDLEEDISFYAPEDQKRIDKAFQRAVEEGEPYDLTLRFQNAQGENLWVRTLSQVEKKGGDIVRVYGHIMDITDLMQAEEELRESEERYRAVVEYSHEGILIVGGDYKFEFVNDMLCDMLGRRREELIGSDFRKYLDEESQILVGERYIRRQRGEDVPPRYEFNIIRKDGEVRRVEISSTTTKDLQGGVKTIAQIIDITDQKLTEKALRQSEARYRYIYETTPVSIFEEDFSAVNAVLNDLESQGETDLRMYFEEHPEYVDQLGKMIEVKDVNEQSLKMFGAESKDELLGSLNKITTPDTRHITQEEILAIREGKTFFGGETTNRTLQGKQLDLLLTMAIPSEEENLDRVLVSMMDITKSKRVASLMLVLNKIAQTMEEALTTQEVFAAAVNELRKHDFECMLMPLDEDRSRLFTRYLSFDSDLLDTAEVLTGLSRDDFSFPVETVNEYSQVVREKKTIFINNPGKVLRQILPRGIKGLAGQLLNLIQIPKAIAAPLIVNQEVFGLFSVNAESLTEDDTPAITAFANLVAAAWHRAQLFEQAQKRLARLHSLHEIDQTISGSLDLKTTLNVLVDKVVQNLEVDAGIILVFQPDMQVLEYITGSGLRSDSLDQTRLRIGECHAGRAVLERKMVMIPDLTLETVKFERAKLIQQEEFVSYYGVPLIAKGETMGVLEVFHRSKLDPAPEWVDFLETLAGQAAIAIDRLNLFNDLQRSNIDLLRAYNEVIEGWARALELRDQETEGHSRRVEKLTMTIAKELGIRDEELAHIHQGALLHDIGKMGVPDSILLKPGKLNEEEWEVMKKHPVFSYQMLSPINHLKPALDIPYCHHEKWDGSGYPRGLKGEDIPIAARIFALVDVWDALRSDRPYRKAWTDEKALEYIKEQAGSHFDPRVVKVFLKIVEP